MRKDPQRRESRLPAIAIWTVTGLLVGVAISVVVSSFPIPLLVGGAIGLSYGLFATRPKFTPDED